MKPRPLKQYKLQNKYIEHMQNTVMALINIQVGTCPSFCEAFHIILGSHLGKFSNYENSEQDKSTEETECEMSNSKISREKKKRNYQ